MHDSGITTESTWEISLVYIVTVLFNYSTQLLTSAGKRTPRMERSRGLKQAPLSDGTRFSRKQLKNWLWCRLPGQIACWSSVLNVFVLSLDFYFNVFYCHLLSTHWRVLVLLLSPWQRPRTGWWRLFGFLSMSSFEHVRGGNTEMRASRSVWTTLSCHKTVREWI